MLPVMKYEVRPSTPDDRLDLVAWNTNQSNCDTVKVVQAGSS